MFYTTFKRHVRHERMTWAATDRARAGYPSPTLGAGSRLRLSPQTGGASRSIPPFSPMYHSHPMVILSKAKNLSCSPLDWCAASTPSPQRFLSRQGCRQPGYRAALSRARRTARRARAPRPSWSNRGGIAQQNRRPNPAARVYFQAARRSPGFYLAGVRIHPGVPASNGGAGPE
jgi:hypothetical protein